MAEVRKFLFDNFVIKTAADDVVEIAVPDISEEKIDQMLMASSELEVPEVVVEVIPEVTYSEDEVQEIVRQAEERGYERGYKSYSDADEAKKNFIIEDMNNKLLNVIASRSEDEAKIEQEFLQMSRLIVQKFIPSMVDQDAVSGIKSFLADNFSNFKREPKLSFYFNPIVINDAQEVISLLASKNDFEGKISIHKDDSLPVNDCRIEWKSGGVEFNNQKMLDKIGVLLEDEHVN